MSDQTDTATEVFPDGTSATIPTRPMQDALGAITASGGFCAPLIPYYSLFGLDGPAVPPRILTRNEKIKRWAQRRIDRRRVQVASWVAGFDVSEDRWD